MPISHMNRRTFLRGAGGATLSLPFLSSLAPSKVRGADDVPIRLVVFVSKFAVYARNWHHTTLDPMERLADHAHTMQLSEFGDRSINKTLGSTYRHLYDKMNFVRGLDMMCANQGHNTPMPLSASCSDRMSEVGTGHPIPSYPVVSHSMDALLDERIYPSAPPVPAIRVAPFLDSSATGMRWQTLSARDGNGLASETSLASVYQQLFGDLSGVEVAGERAIKARRLSSLDAALPEIRRTLSNPSLSAEDKSTLNTYLDRIQGLRNNIDERMSRVCVDPGLGVHEVDGYDTPLEFHQQLNQMITAAFSCDLTRIAIVNVNHGTNNPRQAYLHPNSHHEFREPGPEFDAVDLGYYQTQAKFYFDLLEQMDAVTEANGKTMLDNSIVVWTNTQGVGDYHRSNNIPVLTAGSANGQIHTGRFLDYERRPVLLENGQEKWRHLGRPYNHFLQDIMRCFGLGPADWELLGAGNGYGDYARAERSDHWEEYLTNRNMSLPGFLIG